MLVKYWFILLIAHSLVTRKTLSAFENESELRFTVFRLKPAMAMPALDLISVFGRGTF